MPFKSVLIDLEVNLCQEKSRIIFENLNPQGNVLSLFKQFFLFTLVHNFLKKHLHVYTFHNR